MLTKKTLPDRSKIDVGHAAQLKCWAHELGVTADCLLQAIEKVGNSAAAVKKQLATQRRLNDGVSNG